MTYPHALTLTWLLAVLLACLLAYDMVHAGSVSVELGAGAAVCNRTIPDGTWVQTGLHHDVDCQNFTWKAGLDYRVSDRWAFQAYYANFGTFKIRQYNTVADEAYNPKEHKCTIADCSGHPFNTDDRMHAIAVSAKHTWSEIGPIQPFIGLGGGVLMHHLTAAFGDSRLRYHGNVPMLLMTGGLCYKLACMDTTYYHGLGGGDDWSAGLPISKEVVTASFTVKVPLWR